MKQSIFHIKPAVYHGHGATGMLARINYARALVITDPFIEKSGMLESLLRQLGHSGSSKVFSEIHPDPDLALVSKGIQVLLEWKPDLVIAFGGGSTIDAAKSILYCANKMTAEEPAYFVAIPTTSGTGSEVTNFSVITLDGKKIPVVDDGLLPYIAIIDASFTASVPPAITADTGMDVLTHALEAYVSTLASNYTDALAEKAVALVFSYLPTAVKHGADKNARAQLHDASCIAGMAFTNAKLGINHSLAHALGGAFHISHGRANASLLSLVIAYNSSSPEAARRYAKLAQLLGLCPKDVEDGVSRLCLAVRLLLKTTGIPSTIAEQGVLEADFQKKLDDLCRTALSDACTETNPVQPSLSDLKNIYLCAYGA